ncbi:polysaccharide deacetylase family protein, partial [Klebsiella pneumoniae]|uniref:polysaccharide deacetylase family protein n=1 Tax=Klebsiella pneumoniae TaxID=573 RepID=UPI003012B0FF
YPYLDAEEFEADVSYLKQEFGFIPYDEIVRRRLSGDDARDNAATLTFDDGFAECDTVVQPILRRHGATCIFFIITDLIDNRAMFRET